MSKEKLGIEELDEMTSIERYIEVLLDKFPNPITQTELAAETSVTKSAISKIRDKLVTICDLKTLGYDKKLLLASDSETFGKVFFFFLFNRMKPKILLKSKYLKTLLKRYNFHEKLTVGLTELSYSEFFEEKDTNKIIEVILYNLSSIQFPQIYSQTEIRKTKMDELGLLMRIVSYLPISEDPFSNIDLALFDTEEELLDLLTLRDKIYYFVMSNCSKLLQKWEVVEEINDVEKKGVYIEAYLKVIDHYACKYIQDFNLKVEKKMEEKKIDFKTSYSEIGVFFKPFKELSGDICHSGPKREAHLPNPGFGEQPFPDKK